MIIRGFLKTTLLDYPGHVAATIFLGGCNMRCVFCHNMYIVEGGDLRINNGSEGNIKENSVDAVDIDEKINVVPSVVTESYTCEEILAHLSRRKNILDGVCITGGEPTLYTELPNFIKEIKSLGFLVKLDTNGTNPEMLKSLIDSGLINYVAMDIKASFDKYEEICGRKCDLNAIEQSINILIKSGMDCGLDYEFRTTVIEEYHDTEEIKKIAQMIKGAKNYYLQSFIDSAFVPNHNLHSVSTSTLDEYSQILKQHVSNVQIRGVE